jgi:hypothetical protein
MTVVCAIHLDKWTKLDAIMLKFALYYPFNRIKHC